VADSGQWMGCINHVHTNWLFVWDTLEVFLLPFRLYDDGQGHHKMVEDLQKMDETSLKDEVHNTIDEGPL
jgi:hypothetical protein